MDKKQEEFIQAQGVVVQQLPDTWFLVRLDNEQDVRGFISGKIRKNHIRILPGDRVTIEFSPYDLSQGRITRRLS